MAAMRLAKIDLVKPWFQRQHTRSNLIRVHDRSISTCFK
jgi:hypothetical protein